MAEINPNRVTRKMANDALRARGRDESLYPGEGYLFFGGGDAVHWLSSSVMVKKISDLTLEEWLAKFDELLERENKLRVQMRSASADKPTKKASRSAIWCEDSAAYKATSGALNPQTRAGILH